jgi:hypothetical protein
MEDRIALLGDQTCFPSKLGFPPHGRPLQLIVPFTNPALTAKSLAAAVEFSRGFQAAVTLVAVYIVPYPAPLECREGIRNCLEAHLTAVARAIPAETRVELIFARDQEDAYRGLLDRKALIVIGSERRWWRTREERLARRLARSGHSVAMIKVR